MREIAFCENRLTERIIYCVFQVHQTLGPGFLESVYRRALLIELRKQSLATAIEREVIIYYDGREVGRHLKASRLTLGLLINFAGERADVRRVRRL